MVVRENSHYINGRAIEPWDVIKDWELCFWLGNALKYISRVGRKENDLSDVNKAIHYLEHYRDNILEEHPQGGGGRHVH